MKVEQVPVAGQDGLAGRRKAVLRVSLHRLQQPKACSLTAIEADHPRLRRQRVQNPNSFPAGHVSDSGDGHNVKAVDEDAKRPQDTLLLSS